MANWLTEDQGIEVYVQRVVHENEFNQFKAFDTDNMGQSIDFMIVLGGDGTLLYLTSLFQGSSTIPPTISFARGSLGFLTPFEFASYKKILTEFLKPSDPHWINIRMRLNAKVFRRRQQSGAGDKEEEEKVENVCIYNVDNDIDNLYECVYDKHGLNEVLIERKGMGMIMMELHVNRKLVSHVQADGLIISTPTGSTAYSVSAGGSLIAPNVPCIGLTPICPHTLSFRPVVIADSSIIHLMIPKVSHGYPKIALDGKFRFELQPTDIIQIQQSKYPLPTFKLKEYQHEWWGGLVGKFNWNVRELQKQGDHY